MKIKKILPVLFFVTTLAYGSDCSYINDQAMKIFAKNQISGMAIAIINQDKVAFCNYGYTNKINKFPITEKSIFEIASLTKTFTALIAGIAAADHKFDLGAPIIRHVPELLTHKEYSEINSQELLSHVAGLPLIFSMKYFDVSEFIHSLLNVNFSSQPGKYYRYSNPGFSLVGLAITRVYNRSFQDLLDEFILDKVGMKYTSVDVSSQNQHLIVTGYNGKNQAVKFMRLGIDNPAGGLKSNTYDLAKYLQLQMDSNDSRFYKALKIVHNNYYCLYEDGTYQQLAWEYHPIKELSEKFQADDEGRNILPPHQIPRNCKITSDGFIDKTGNSPGMTSYIGYVPKTKVGVVILSNSAKKPDIVNLGRYVLQKTMAKIA